MAGKKQYEMLFALNARMNGGFSGTFTKAQAEFTRLGKEIQSLHKVQGDISSYQKQQAALENTRSKLESLQKQHDLLQKEISETTGSTAGLEREKVKLEERIRNTEAALERQNQKLTATGDRLRATGADTDNLAQKDQELTARIKELEAEQEKAAKGAGDFGQTASEAFGAVQQAIAAAGIANAMKEITGAFVECVGIAGDFEEAMSTVEALSQANEREMSALTAEAKELGAATKFTAKESADAMGYMAMAGWDAAEMLSGMNGVLQLAAASGEDLAMTSDIVTDSLTAFGLTAADTAHFSDVLAVAASKSNTNVAIMGETFKQSAPLVGALGYSIEDVATAVGLMANAGVKGSIAGTTLKNIFNGLLGGATLTSAAFGEIEFSAVRADGTMKDFAATIDELRGYFGQMSEAEKMTNAETLAGMRGYAGLLAILNATDESYQSLTSNINNCTGAAERMAKIKLDNLNGQLTLMNSAWDAVKTTIGEQFIPELRDMAEVGTDALTWVNGFIKDNPAVVKGVVTFTGAMGAAAVAITGVNAAMKVFQLLNMASLFTNPIFLAAGAVSALAAGVVAVTTATNDSVPPVRELTEAAREMKEAMDEAGISYENSALKTMATAETADIYISRLEAIEAATGGNVEGNQEYQNILGLLLRTVPELSDCISETTDEYGRSTYALETSTEALRKNTAEWEKSARAKAYQDYINSLYDDYGSVLAESAENSIKLTQAELKLEETEKKRDDALKRMSELSEAAYKNNGVLTDEYYDLENAVFNYNDEIQEAESNIQNLNKAMETDAGAVSEAEAAIDQAQAAYEKLNDTALEQIGILPELENALGPLRNEMDKLAMAYNNAYEAAIASFSGQFGLFDEAKADMNSTVAAAQKALDSQLAYWKNYSANIAVLKEISAEDLGVTQANYDKMMEYVRKGTPEAAGLAASMAKAVNSGNTKALTDLGNTIGEISESQDQAAQDMAVWTSGLTDQMGQLITDVEAEVKKLDLSAEAAESARKTIQAYINEAEKMTGPLQTAFKGLWQSALDTMPAVVPVSAAVSSDPSNANAGPNAKMRRPARGYATGTQNAVPGWAWVGEEGPELMRFSGGEQVLNARQSAALSAEPAGAGGTSQVQVVFNIAGNASQETVQDLRAFGDEIVSRVLDTLEEEQADRARRAIR